MAGIDLTGCLADRRTVEVGDETTKMAPVMDGQAAQVNVSVHDTSLVDMLESSKKMHEELCLVRPVELETLRKARQIVRQDRSKDKRDNPLLVHEVAPEIGHMVL